MPAAEQPFVLLIGKPFVARTSSRPDPIPRRVVASAAKSPFLLHALSDVVDRGVRRSDRVWDCSMTNDELIRRGYLGDLTVTNM